MHFEEHHIHDEFPIVADADARVQPVAVVVEALNAVTAQLAMPSTFSDCDVADAAHELLEAFVLSR